MRVAVALSLVSLAGCVQQPALPTGPDVRPSPRPRPAAGEGRAGARFFARTDGGEERPLALRALTVQVTTRPGTVRSHLAMEIAGPPDRRVEAVMRLPVPRSAAVTRAVLWIDGRPMNGAFVDRERGEQIYRAIVARRRDPAIVTSDGPGWLAVSIFPLERGQARRFELEWVEPAALGAGGTIAYRVPMVSERGQLLGRAALEVDGHPVDAPGRELVTLDAPAARASAVVGRAPGDPFARVLVRGQPAGGAAHVAILAETSAAMTAADRARQHAAIAAVLGGLPAEARVSLLAADWDVVSIAADMTPADAAAALPRLDAIVSAGALHLGRALAAAAARVRSGAANAVLFVGRGTDAFGDDAVHAPLDAFRRTGAALSAVTFAGLPWPFVEAAELTGGEAAAGPLDAEGLAALLRALAPAPSRPAVALRGIEDWRPLDTIAGQPLWIGRALGAAAQSDEKAAVPVEGDAADLLALWDRARLMWFDGRPRPRAERTPPAALTPLRALLVLESEQDYARHGLAVPERISDDAPAERAMGNDASDVLAGLVEHKTAGLFGLRGTGIAATGAGGTAEGTIGVGGLHAIGYGRGAIGLGGRRALGPQVIAGQASVGGSLDKEIIRRVIRRHVNEVQYCYEQRLQAKPDLGGRITVQFTIGTAGSVTTSVVESSTLADARAESCVVQAVRRWEFPHPVGGAPAVVSYPFVFVPRGQTEQAPAVASSPAPAGGPDPAVTGALAILGGPGPLAGRVERVATSLDLPETADAEILAWTVDRAEADVDLIVLVARLLVAAGHTHDAVRVLSERAVASPARVAAELRRIGQDAEAGEVLTRAHRPR